MDFELHYAHDTPEIYAGLLRVFGGPHTTQLPVCHGWASVLVRCEKATITASCGLPLLSQKNEKSRQ